ncbi:MAG TPA: alanine--tRNA ligase [Bacteroidia bacterium]|nr:alanine--tRNA ligase [Bacteroidia bacterium]
MNANEIRRTFLDFFKSKGHEIVPSAPMVVKNDPTLMFINSGMAPFKDWFLGNAPAKWPRVADTQKCLRVSGKHNDLEEVGVDTYHHTMFEMLGNWSFGDYFKKEAIAWSWELLTEVYKLPKDRLYVTVFEGSVDDKLAFDQEAYNEWMKYTTPDRILKGNKKDNFWEMGDTGPCGPCTEIHFDSRSDAERKAVEGATLVNADHPQVIEIWNNVFMEFQRKADGSLEKLPAQHVDTGMGFERLVRVLQGKQSNYDTDIFMPLINTIEKLTGTTYGGTDSKQDIATRVLSDHIRTISFAIADGQLPSNTGAGYVIRRILRRAARYYYTFLNIDEPLLYNLVDTLVLEMGEFFPELKKQQSLITNVIEEEERSFLRTIGYGIQRFEEYVVRQYTFGRNNEFLLSEIKKDLGEAYARRIYLMQDGGKLTVTQDGDSLKIDFGFNQDYLSSLVDDRESILVPSDPSHGPIKKIRGDFAYKLYDTYGFPKDLTELMAREIGWIVDTERYHQLEKEQKDRSRAATAIDTDDWVELKKNATSVFVGYDKVESDANIIRYRRIKAKGKESYQLVLDVTPFYAESGGQVGDTGSLDSVNDSVRVLDTKKENGVIVHFVEKLPEDVNKTFRAVVDVKKRRNTEGHHSATHLLHAALRKVLGTHVEQKGSLVNEEYLRFDFSHFQKVTDDEVAEIEKIVNEKIRENIQADIREMGIEDAKKKGAMALFGEKYGDVVRVVTFDEKYSIELCGGTHVKASGQIGLFKIISEGAIAAGIRRIEAISGERAERFVNEQQHLVAELKNVLKNPKDVLKSVQQLIDEKSALEKQMESLVREKAKLIRGELAKKATSVNGMNFIAEKIELNSADAIKELAYALREQIDSLFLVIGAEVNGKASLTLMLSDNLVKEKNMDANKMIRELAKEIQGGGGGQAFYATSGGTNTAGIESALKKAKEFIQ